MWTCLLQAALLLLFASRAAAVTPKDHINDDSAGIRPFIITKQQWMAHNQQADAQGRVFSPHSSALSSSRTTAIKKSTQSSWSAGPSQSAPYGSEALFHKSKRSLLASPAIVGPPSPPPPSPIGIRPCQPRVRGRCKLPLHPPPLPPRRLPKQTPPSPSPRQLPTRLPRPPPPRPPHPPPQPPSPVLTLLPPLRASALPPPPCKRGKKCPAAATPAFVSPVPKAQAAPPVPHSPSPPILSSPPPQLPTSRPPQPPMPPMPPPKGVTQPTSAPGTVTSAPGRQRKPNFVVIMTDDQEDILNSTHAAYMPALDRLLRQGGTQLSNFLVSTGVCCPARASLLTGKLAHCTNVTANKGNRGGYSQFLRNGHTQDYLPLWMEALNYSTALIGKFMNGFNPVPGNCPPGWDVFETMSSVQTTYDLRNPCFVRNCDGTVTCPGMYQSDAIAAKGRAFIRDAVAAGKPFFVLLTPTAPHIDNSGKGWLPPFPAARHEALFPGLKQPRLDNWWVRDPLNPLATDANTQSNWDAMDSLYAQRIRSLVSVDEMLEALVQQLSSLGVLDDTYILYTSDNGYHMGAFGLPDGKGSVMEEDVRVPFFIRGPGILAGQVLPYQGNMVDIPATILALAGGRLKDDFNGLVLPIREDLKDLYFSSLYNATVQYAAVPPVPPTPDEVLQLKEGWRRDTTILEVWDSNGAVRALGLIQKALRLCTPYRIFPDSGSSGRAAQDVAPLSVHTSDGRNGRMLTTDRNNAGDAGITNGGAWVSAGPGAGAVRISPAVLKGRRPSNSSSSSSSSSRGSSGGLVCYKYVAWCQGGRALHDLSTDPNEVNNKHKVAPEHVLDRLDALLSVLVHCQGADCRSPYSVLHRDGSVRGFEQAMQPQYDAMYAAKPKFYYRECLSGYEVDNEVTWTQQGGL